MKIINYNKVFDRGKVVSSNLSTEEWRDVERTILCYKRRKEIKACSSLTKTELIDRSPTAMHRYNTSPATGLTSNDISAKCCFSSSNVV